MSTHAYSNVAKKKKMREVQQWTLRELKDILLPSAGCYGSTTQILKGDPTSSSGLSTVYSKDGHTILSAVRFNRAIEDSIKRECTEMTRYIVKEVGDGTTSTIILSSIIFDYLCEKLGDKYAPYQVINSFKKVVGMIQENIKNYARPLTLEDVYTIAMICTNNNKSVSKTLAAIYEKQGLDVFIDVAASVTDHDTIKYYDGLTLGVGYSDPVYINTRPTKATDEQAGYSIIKDARVYAFVDPIDTLEMTNYFNAIIANNIMRPIHDYSQTGDKKHLDEVIPTVIMAPKISLDLNTAFNEIVSFMYQFNDNLVAKPPLLIITNIGTTYYEAYSDIWQLAKCKPIKKYIDPAIQEKEQASGGAPTIETIVEFYGKVKEVRADAYKTTFIEPAGMFAYDKDGNMKVDEDGAPVYSENYKGQVAFLEQELKVAIDSNESIDVIGNLRRRVHTLKANMVDYFVGGVNITDRDSTRDLVEDAVKNIRSAAEDGVGYGTNFEGLRSSLEVRDRMRKDPKCTVLDQEIADLIADAYVEMSKILYKTCFSAGEDESKIMDYIDQSINEHGCPMNFTSMVFDGSVLCTIKQDIVILEVIAKIITIMFTTNQSLVQAVEYNMYLDEDE